MNIRKPRSDDDKKKQNIVRDKKGQFDNGTGPSVDKRPFLKRNSELRDMIDGHAEDLIETVVQLAKAGSEPALKMCLDRILPTKKYDTIKIHLYNKVKTLNDIRKTSGVICEDVCNGFVSPEQGKVVMDILSVHRENIEREEFSERIENIERVLNVNRPTTEVVVENFDDEV